jgi:hypothetical protein
MPVVLLIRTRAALSEAGSEWQSKSQIGQMSQWVEVFGRDEQCLRTPKRFRIVE